MSGWSYFKLTWMVPEIEWFALFPKQTECYQSCNPPTAYRSTRVLCWVHKSLQQIGYCHNRRNSHWSSRSQRQMTRFQHTLGNHSKSARRTAFQNNYPPEHIFCFCDPQWWKWPVDIPAHGKPRHPGGNSRPRWHRKNPPAMTTDLHDTRIRKIRSHQANYEEKNKLRNCASI